MNAKNLMEAGKNIDYQLLKRNMEELGLSNHHKIESILQRNRPRQEDELEELK
jgi:hypothetical protein